MASEGGRGQVRPRREADPSERRGQGQGELRRTKFSSDTALSVFR